MARASHMGHLGQRPSIRSHASHLGASETSLRRLVFFSSWALS